jgi:hypothetical protein
MIFSENRFTLCADAALRVRIMRYRLPRPRMLPVATSGASQEALPRSGAEHL